MTNQLLALGRAAHRLRAARFQPALVDGCRVPAWASQLIIFDRA